MTDDSTLKKALEGDINSFQQLFAEFQEPLKSYLYRLLASRSDADDITHDTFIRAYDKLHLYRGESSLKTWVFQIATNLAAQPAKNQKALGTRRVRAGQRTGFEQYGPCPVY